MNKSSKRLAVYTTVYPGVQPFLHSWYRSVAAQVDRDFDLWISVDSLGRDEVIAAMGSDPRAQWLDANKGDSPAQIRQDAIEKMAHEYFGVIFVDSDDILDPRRVQAARAGLVSFDVIGCGLKVVDEQGGYLGIIFGESNTDIDRLLPRYNIFGLSNTAYRSQTLKHCLPLPSECEVIDWFLATQAWASGARMVFDQAPMMAYRRHDRNTAPLLPPFAPNEVAKAAKRVSNHYRLLLEGESRLSVQYRSDIEVFHDSAALFERSILSSNDTLDAYVHALNAIPPRYVWWWCVAHPALEHIWKQ